MNRDLEIPPLALKKAVDALYEARLSKATSVGDAAESVLLAGAPIIVAAKLRRMADEVEASETDNLWGRRELRFLADKLDPGGASS